MAEYQNVIVLQEESIYRNTFVEGLTAYGFAVRSCGGILGFSHLYTTQPTPIVVLISPPPSLEAHVAKVRKITASAAIIVLSQNLDADCRIRIMAAGADGCHSICTDVRELASILTAWMRRVSVLMNIKMGLTSDHERAQSWQLSINGRVLTSPHGRSLPLTGSESHFLKCLATNDGHLVRRQHPHSVDQPLCPDTSYMRNIDPIASRLRRKARHLGINLPLRAVRGLGYLFAEPLE